MGRAMFRIRTTCRFCDGASLRVFMSFGDVPLAGGFFKPGSEAADFAREKRYPLDIACCADCALVQVPCVVDASELFEQGYFYFSSQIPALVLHFEQYADKLAELLPSDDRSTIKLLELGCNDGVLLRPLRAKGFHVIGVDPATNVTQSLRDEGYTVYSAFFDGPTASKVKAESGPVDVILSSNSFAHIDDMREVLSAVRVLLKPDGFLAFEVHHLLSLVQNMQYDFFYHEHFSYYSLMSLRAFLHQFSMHIFDVHELPMHA